MQNRLGSVYDANYEITRIGKSKYKTCKIQWRSVLREISLVPMIWHLESFGLDNHQAVVRQSRCVQVVGFRRSVSVAVGGVAPLEGFRPEGLVEDFLAGLTG